jgi:hypothetical protein
MNQLVRDLRVESLILSPLTPTVGAEVSGIDPAAPLDVAVTGDRPR